MQISGRGRSLLTGAEGEFAFDGVPAGGVFIALTKPGYFAPGTTVRYWSAGSNVVVGPDTGKIVLKMAPEAVISGRVTGQDDEPLERANISVFTPASIDGRQVLTQRSGVATDEDGNFRVAALPAGRYYLAVHAGHVTRRVLGAQTPSAPEAYPAVIYYPGTTDLGAAAALDLAPGQKLEAMFSLALGPAYKLAGQVTAAGEWKQVNAPTIIDPMDQALLTPDQFDGQTGAFEFRAVPAGSYTVRVGGTDQENRYTFSDRKITVSKNITDLKLSLRPGLSIPVEVRNEFSKPQQRGPCLSSGLSGVVQQPDCPDYPAAMVELISMDSANLRFSTDFRPVRNSSPYAVHAVTPGKYMVRARPSQGGYVQSVRSGEVDLLREVLTVPEEGTVAPIEIVLRDDSGTLQVTLRAQKRGQNATILVSPDGAPVSTPNVMGTNLPSTTLSAIAPGNYKVFAFDSIEGMDYSNPEVLAKYAAQAASVTVAPNGNASVIVDVIHVGE